MNEFQQLLSLLKTRLGVGKDLEVAAMLGMSKSAFSERKRRGSIPLDELRALARSRPELQIDVAQWEHSGVRRPSPALSLEPPAWQRGFGQRLALIRGKESMDSFAKALGITADQLAQIEAGQQSPPLELIARLSTLRPDLSIPYLTGAPAPALSVALDQVETILIANYRAASEEGQESLRHMAAFLADYRQSQGRYTPSNTLQEAKTPYNPK